MLRLSTPGIALTVGPFATLPAVFGWVETYGPGQDTWRHEYLTPIPPDHAAQHFAGHATSPRHDVAQPLTTHLQARLAQLHPNPEDADTAALQMVLAAHHAWLVELHDPQCLEQQCGHPCTAGGHCTQPPTREVLCRACTPTLTAQDAEEFLPGLRITWPCAVVTALATELGVNARQAALAPLHGDEPDRLPLPTEPPRDRG